MFDKKGILIVRDDLCKVVDFAQKSIEAGVDEAKVFATIEPCDIIRFLNTKSIAAVIIDSEMYNLNTASILKNYSQVQELQILLLTDSKSKRTIRMMMDKNLKYVNSNISSRDLNSIFLSLYAPSLKKVAHF